MRQFILAAEAFLAAAAALDGLLEERVRDSEYEGPFDFDADFLRDVLSKARRDVTFQLEGWKVRQGDPF